MFSSLFSFSQNENCEPIKRGKYFYYAPNGGVVTVVRKRKKQIERYNDESQKFTFGILQIDSCNYELTLIKVKGMSKDQKAEILGKKIQVEVVSAELDEYQLEIIRHRKKTKKSLTLYKD